LDAGTRERLSGAALREAGWSEPAASAYAATYFDDAERSFAKRRLAVRIETVGGARFEVVERLSRDHSWLGRRRTWRKRTRRDRPTLAGHGGDDLESLLPDGCPAAELAPAFAIGVDRIASVSKPKRGVALGLTIDAGRMSAGRRGRPLVELTLALARGAPADLIEAALGLHRAVAPLVLEPDEVCVRGLRLAAGSDPAPYRARPLVLEPGWTAEEACKAILSGGLTQVLANQACALLGRDIEGLHQLRVGIRRIRTAFAVLRPLLPRRRRSRFRDGMRMLGDATGEAREWDVLLDELIRPALADAPRRRGLAALARAAERRRSRAYAHLRRTLAAPEHTDLMLRFMAWLEEPWAETAKPRLRRELARMMALHAGPILRAEDHRLHRLGDGLDPADAERLHRVRLAAKRVRYTTESLVSLVPERAAAAYLEVLKDVQEHFGASNDAAFAYDRLVGLRVPGAAKLARELVARGPSARMAADLREVWARFAATTPLHVAMGYDP
jgi:CHAD domain-containing protein